MILEQGASHGSLFDLSFQKSNVFVNCGSADVADPCEFRHIQLLALVYLLSYLIKMWYYGCNINSPEFYYISGGYGSAQLEAVH